MATDSLLILTEIRQALAEAKEFTDVLAVMLRNCQAEWVLSYDDHPEIRRLYSWARIKPVEIRYVMAKATGPTRPKNQEIVIARLAEARG